MDRSIQKVEKFMIIHDETKVPEFLAMLDELTSTHLEIGIFGEDDSDMVMIGTVHEFGMDIKLKKSGKVINIPERSFIRAGYDQEKENIIRESEKLLEKVIVLELPVKVFFETMGELMVGMIQKYLTDLKYPPNAPSTITYKGSSNPLIDEGHLRDSITYKVVRD